MTRRHLALSLALVGAVIVGVVVSLGGRSMKESPAWPGTWTGSGVCTPWARMQRVKSTMF